MSFEYRELTTHVLLNAGREDKEEKSPKSPKEDECDECPTCGTTTLDTGSAGCREDDDQGEGRQALGLLRQQLRDTLAAG